MDLVTHLYTQKNKNKIKNLKSRKLLRLGYAHQLYKSKHIYEVRDKGGIEGQGVSYFPNRKENQDWRIAQ